MALRRPHAATSRRLASAPYCCWLALRPSRLRNSWVACQGCSAPVYGQIALAKLALFIVLLTLAALNRLALTERLAETRTGGARRLMQACLGGRARDDCDHSG